MQGAITWLIRLFAALSPIAMTRKTVDAFEENSARLAELRQLHPKKSLDELKEMMGKYLHRESLRSRLSIKIARLRMKINSSQFRRKLHKWVFTLNFIRLIGEFYLLGKAPCYYPAWHTVMAAVLLSGRIVYFRMLRYHYFLVDFCYYANGMLLFYIWKYPDSEWLGSAVWGYSFGSLLFSVPLYSNTVVLHNLDKTTSGFIHLSPAITLWSMRWFSCTGYYLTSNTPDLLPFLARCILLYLIWAVLYYVLIFVLTFKRCQAKHNLTLYTWMLEDTTAWPYRVSGTFGDAYRPLVFMSYHMLVLCVGLLISYACLISFVFCTALTALIGFICIWNTASYYMDYFAKDYEKRLHQLEALQKQQ